MPDLLQGAGLSAILERYFSPLEVETFPGVDAALREGGCYDCYFTDAVTFAAHIDFFLPRRTQCVLLLPCTPEAMQSAGDTPRVIPTADSLENLIEHIGRVLSPVGKSGEETSQSDELSAREVQVLQLVVSGAINKEIADRLNISLNTVLTHRKNITSKLGIKTISGLTLYALMHGYISTEDMVL